MYYLNIALNKKALNFAKAIASAKQYSH